VTTPAQIGILLQLTSMFGSLDAYSGIDSILEDENIQAWRPNTETTSIAVRSNRPIRPAAVEIALEKARSSTLELLGLSVTLEKKAVLTSLGKHQVEEGVNRINCLTI
jgi:hypothetical protein